MKSFIAKHAGTINAILECFDRVILPGHLPLASLGYCLTWLHCRPITLRAHDVPAGWQRFKDGVPAFAERLKTQAKTLAEQAGRPYQDLPAHERMEQQARLLAEKDGITRTWWSDADDVAASVVESAGCGRMAWWPRCHARAAIA